MSKTIYCSDCIRCKECEEKDSKSIKPLLTPLKNNVVKTNIGSEIYCGRFLPKQPMITSIFAF